jgi:hypothetical protein
MRFKINLKISKVLRYIAGRIDGVRGVQNFDKFDHEHHDILQQLDSAGQVAVKNFAIAKLDAQIGKTK